MKNLFLVLILSLIYCECTAQNTGTFTDNRDGKVYKTVTIGTQTWFAENLAFEPKKGNYWAYNDDESNISEYGYLYDLKTALKVCPSGWHLPSKEEIKTLLDFYKTDDSKDKGQAAFEALIEGGISGFSALLCGYRTSSGKYKSMDSTAYFWSSTYSLELERSSFLRFHTKPISTAVSLSFSIGNSGRSIRCIQGEAQNETSTQNYSSTNTQVPNVTGLWQSLNGNQFQLETRNGGFLFKNINDNQIAQATHILNNPYGSPMYRADFGNVFFLLFTVVSNEKILVADSRNTNEIITWNRIINNSNYQNQSNNYQNQSNSAYQQAQQRTADLIPGTSYLTKKRYLETQKSTLKSQLKRAEEEYKNAPVSSHISYQPKIDRLNREINDIDMKILDLDQMKLRGEIR